jgi:hypothetical protein
MGRVFNTVFTFEGLDGGRRWVKMKEHGEGF